jgi:hypothetical protein
LATIIGPYSDGRDFDAQRDDRWQHAIDTFTTIREKLKICEEHQREAHLVYLPGTIREAHAGVDKAHEAMWAAIDAYGNRNRHNSHECWLARDKVEDTFSDYLRALDAAGRVLPDLVLKAKVTPP